MRVDRKAPAFLVPGITQLRIPAVGRGETLIVGVALGEVVLLKRANRLVRPRFLRLTVQLRMAVAVLSAVFAELEALANAVIAILRHTLAAMGARATVVEVRGVECVWHATDLGHPLVQC